MKTLRCNNYSPHETLWDAAMSATAFGMVYMMPTLRHVDKETTMARDRTLIFKRRQLRQEIWWPLLRWAESGDYLVRKANGWMGLCAAELEYKANEGIVSRQARITSSSIPAICSMLTRSKWHDERKTSEEIASRRRFPGLPWIWLPQNAKFGKVEVVENAYEIILYKQDIKNLRVKVEERLRW